MGRGIGLLAEENQMARSFSNWSKWAERTTLNGLNYPGIYVIAISRRDISGTPFQWCSEIVYIGMTNAKGGLKSRLKQFDNTIKGGDGHGGGQRFRFKYPNHNRIVPLLYIAVCPFKCDVTSNNPVDLRIMGNVAKQEYECFAVFVDMFGKLPEFNDKKRSPKK
ncbi:MAG: hypothetical protein J7L51_00220 [Desulfurococcales archaeon]|nr:hypothetical protein [Desulfurococcales archaeon]